MILSWPIHSRKILFGNDGTSNRWLRFFGRPNSQLKDNWHRPVVIQPKPDNEFIFLKQNIDRHINTNKIRKRKTVPAS